MKKVLVIGIFFFILSFNLVSAYPGVTPSSYNVDFSPNLKQSFAFRFLMPEDARADISVDGELAKYVKIDKKTLKGEGVVIALVDLPEKVETPGINIIRIRAKDIVKESEGVGISLSVAGLIRIRVPYPGKYVELDYKVFNANQGEDVNFELIAYSRGEEDVYATVYMDIYDSNNVLIERINLGNRLIKSKESQDFSGKIQTKNYVAGDYNASVIVEYGGENPAVSSKVFRLGRLFVDVSNYTREVERGKINRFEIEGESFWNEEIENLYAEVKILDYDIDFRTPSVALSPWGKRTMIGHFDTSEIEENKFKANITLYYYNESTSKIVDVRFKKEVNYLLYVGIGVAVLVILVFLGLVVRLFKKKYKLVKNDGGSESKKMKINKSEGSKK
jgi:hypothetical protein